MQIMSEKYKLRLTTEHDLDFVLAAETDAENSPYIGIWSREEHLNSLTNPDFEHLIVEDIAKGKLVGYIILQNVLNPSLSLQLRRLVVVEKGQGIGREALKLVKKLVFEEKDTHRLWLDVKVTNSRARHLYASEGFVEEGILREAFKYGDTFESLALMSVLRSEYFSS